MALYLDQAQRDYLKVLLAKQSSFWIRDGILSKIEADEQRLQQIADCKHSFAEYKGQKHCCAKCGGLAIGMGESWALKKKLSKKKVQELEDSVKIPESEEQLVIV